MPRLNFIRPLSPSAAFRPPKGDDWLHEPKWDGFRFQVIKDNAGVRFYSPMALNIAIGCRAWSPSCPHDRQFSMASLSPIDPRCFEPLLHGLDNPLVLPPRNSAGRSPFARAAGSGVKLPACPPPVSPLSVRSPLLSRPPARG